LTGKFMAESAKYLKYVNTGNGDAVTALPEQDAPAALASHSSVFSFTDMLHDADLTPGCLPLGYNAETGALCQAAPKDLTCVDILGKQNFAKTTFFKALAMGFFKLQDEGQDIELYLIDPHAGLPDSATLFLKPVLNRFTEAVLGEQALEDGQHIELLQKIEQELNQRQEQGYNTPYLVLMIDEIHDIFDVESHAKEFYRLLKKLRRLRKAGLFQVLVHHDSTKEGQGNKGTGLMNLNVSAFVVNSTKSKAQKILENGDADKALNLERGKAVLKVPGGESDVVCLPFVNQSDLALFLPSEASQNDSGRVNAERPDPGIESVLNRVETAKDAVDKHETHDDENAEFLQRIVEFKEVNKWSLGELSRQSGVDKGQLSKILNGKTPLTENVRNSLETLLHASSTKVIQFRRRG